MVFDGVMVILACTCLTVMHPGIGLGGKCSVSKFSLVGTKKIDREVIERSLRSVDKRGLDTTT